MALFMPTFLNASETFLYEQVRHYARYEPEVFARRRSNEDRFPESRVFALVPGGPLRQAEALLQRVSGYSPSFLARLRERGHDLLHPQFGRAGLAALPCRRALAARLVVTFRGHDLAFVAGTAGIPHPWLGPRRREMFRVAARILTVSSELAERVVELGAPSERVVVWHAGVRIPPEPERREVVRPTPERPLDVVMAGRFVEKKGFEHGIEAVARLASAGTPVRLTLLGEGPLRPSYESLARSLALGDAFALPGMLAQARLFDRIAAADVVVVPSVTARDGDREGVPNVLKEASVRGVAVVATRHGGNAEAVEDGTTGLLVPERDVRALTAALATLAADPALRERMGRAGRRKIEREFDVVRQVAELEDLYDRVRREPAPA